MNYMINHRFFHMNEVLKLFFSSIRHRLEEGQASSWSRRLKFFMCCTRAQDTQSVSLNIHSFLSRVKRKTEKTETINIPALMFRQLIIIKKAHYYLS